jgi:hypothetical protein
MEFRWIAALALWTVLSGPVLVDVVVSGNSGRQPQKVLVGRCDMTRSPGAGWNTPSSPTWTAPGRR